MGLHPSGAERCPEGLGSRAHSRLQGGAGRAPPREGPSPLQSGARGQVCLSGGATKSDGGWGVAPGRGGASDPLCAV